CGNSSAGGVVGTDGSGSLSGSFGSTGITLGGHGQGRGCHGRVKNPTASMALSESWAAGGADGIVWAAQGSANPRKAAGPLKIHVNFFIATPFPSRKKRASRAVVLA